MTKYEKRLTKDIEQRFNALTAKELEKVTKEYFEDYGGEDGCEECFDTHSLCFQCEQCLINFIRKDIRRI